MGFLSILFSYTYLHQILSLYTISIIKLYFCVLSFAPLITQLTLEVKFTQGAVICCNLSLGVRFATRIYLGVFGIGLSDLSRLLSLPAVVRSRGL